MSYNVAICTPPIPAAAEDAWSVIDHLIDAQGDVPPVFKELHERLTAKYPCLCSPQGKGDADDAVIRKQI